jgi:hypothetical protein
MPTIKLVGTAPLTFNQSGNFVELLIQSLKGRNYCVTEDFKADILLCINHVSKDYSNYQKITGNKGIKILLRIEPDSVWPLQYQPRIESGYDTVLNIGAVPGLLNYGEDFNHPYVPFKNPLIASGRLTNSNFEYESSSIFSARKKTLVYVGSNKCDLTVKSMYEIRRSILSGFNKNEIEIYGRGWQQNMFQRIPDRLRTLIFSYRNHYYPNLIGVYRSLKGYFAAAQGEIDDKNSIYRSAKFVLVMENSKSFLTEKIFDVILAGSIPIYFGPALESFGIPENVVLRAEPTSNSIKNLIRSLSLSEIEACRFAGYEFFRSDNFQKNWQADTVANKVVSYIHDFHEAISKHTL